MTDTAIEKARRFALPGQSGDLVKFDPALMDVPVPDDLTPEGMADFADLEGYHPDLAIKTELKAHEGETVVLVAVQFSPTPPQFLSEKQAKGLQANPLSAVFTWLGKDGRYYLALAGNNRAMRQAERLHTVLRRVEGVRATIVGFDSIGGRGYAFGAGS